METGGAIKASMTETVSGRFIDLVDPRPYDIHLDDIAWALSRQVRYAGHTMSRIPYTIGQHTVMVSRYVEYALTPGHHLYDVFRAYVLEKLTTLLITSDEADPEYEKWIFIEQQSRAPDEEVRRNAALHGLIHDFAEAYLVDLPTPVKRLPGVYEAYKVAENRMDDLIFQVLGLHDGDDRVFSQALVSWADMYALLVEAYHFMPSRGLNWNIPLKRPTLQMLYSFRWPMINEEVYREVLDRFEEVRPHNV